LGGYHYPEKREEQQLEGKFEMPFRDGFYEHLMNCGEYIAINMFQVIKSGYSERQPNYHLTNQDLTKGVSMPKPKSRRE